MFPGWKWSDHFFEIFSHFQSSNPFKQMFSLFCIYMAFLVLGESSSLLWMCISPRNRISAFYQLSYWRNLVVGLTEFSKVWILLIASLWCHLIRSSFLFISYKVVVIARGLFGLVSDNFWSGNFYVNTWKMLYILSSARMFLIWFDFFLFAVLTVIGDHYPDPLIS